VFYVWYTVQMVMNVYMLRMEMLWLIRSVCGWELSANKVQADKAVCEKGVMRSEY